MANTAKIAVTTFITELEMTMPTFEPDWTNISSWWDSGSEDWEGFQEVVMQALTEAYEAGKRDAIPKDWMDKAYEKAAANASAKSR